jgi:hypothetical protein
VAAGFGAAVVPVVVAAGGAGFSAASGAAACVAAGADGAGGFGAGGGWLAAVSPEVCAPAASGASVAAESSNSVGMEWSFGLRIGGLVCFVVSEFAA